MPEARPFGETFFEASERAMTAALLVNRSCGGCVESVVTFFNHFFFAVFFFAAVFLLDFLGLDSVVMRGSFNWKPMMSPVQDARKACSMSANNAP